MKMIRIQYILSLFLSLTVGCSLQAQQTVGAILDKAIALYGDTTNYDTSMQYQMLRGLSGEVVAESYEASLSKTGDLVVFKIMDIEYVQSTSKQLVIDHDSKKVRLLQEAVSASQNPLDIKKYLEVYDAKLLEEQSGYWVLGMVPKKMSNVLPYGKIIMNISKKDYHIVNQELFLSNPIPYRTPEGTEMDYGRMQIKTLTWNPNTIADRLFSDYIISTNNTKALQGDLSSYTLLH